MLDVGEERERSSLGSLGVMMPSELLDDDSFISESMANCTVPSDPSMSCAPSTSGASEDLQRESMDMFPTNHSSIDSSVLNNLRSALASQHRELQQFIADWQGRQHQTVQSVLTNGEDFKEDLQCSSYRQPPYVPPLNLTALNGVHMNGSWDTQRFARWDTRSCAAQISQSYAKRPPTVISSTDENQEISSSPHDKPDPESVTLVAPDEAPSAASRITTADTIKMVKGYTTDAESRSRGLSYLLKDGSQDSQIAIAGIKLRLNLNIGDLNDWCVNKYQDSEKLLQGKGNPSCLVKGLLSSAFAALTATVILLNSFFIGYASEYARQNLHKQSSTFIDVLEFLFSMFYMVELMLRIRGFGWCFIFTPDWRWNLFDALLVLIAIWDQCSQLMQTDELDTSYMRVARLPKMFRLIRVFRIMRMFRPLRLIVSSIIGSMKAMLWSVVLICLITYVNAVVILQACTALLTDTIAAGTEFNEPIIDKYWGCIKDSMLTLYSSCTGGLDWYDVAETIKPLGTFYYVIFLLYMTFFIFVVMNTLTSLFVTTASRNAERDQQNIITEELRKKHEHIRTIRKMFGDIAKHDQQKLTQPDFDIVLHDSEMLAFMSSLEIEPLDVEQFFSILSNDGKDGVDIETFVVGCMRMGGQARSMDLLGLIHSHKLEFKKIRNIEKDMAVMRELLQGRNSHDLRKEISSGSILASTCTSSTSPMQQSRIQASL